MEIKSELLSLYYPIAVAAIPCTSNVPEKDTSCSSDKSGDPGFLGKCELCRKKTLAYIKELIRRWHLAVPEWRRLSLKREKTAV